MKFLALSAAAVALFATNAVAIPTPELDLSQVYFESIDYGGTGCPGGSAAASLSTDRKTFTLIFDSYVARVGPGIDAEDRKNCQINIHLYYPHGIQYSLFSADYRGYVKLDKGVTGTQKATYYFAGNTAQHSSETNWDGPISKDYLIHDETDFKSTMWSPCGDVRALNINSQIRLDNSENTDGSGYLTTDSTDGKVSFILGLRWQPCKV